MSESKAETVAEPRPAAPDSRADEREERAAAVSAKLGSRVRALRLEQNHSLRAIAEIARISPSLLSQIERGDASPSLLSMVAIADALGVRPAALFDERNPHQDSPVVRRGDRLIVEDELCRREFMMHLDDPYLEVAELILAPGGETRHEMASHSGRDYGLVMAGQVVVEIESKLESLGRGDYIAFDSQRPHRVVNRSSRPARVLWIVANERAGVGGAIRRISPRAN